MELIDVVRKLVGPVNPVGETNADNDRFENLKELTSLVNMLLNDIDQVSTARVRIEFSMCRAGKYAHEFLAGLPERRGETR